MVRVVSAILIGGAMTVFPFNVPTSAETSLLDYTIQGDAVPQPLGGLAGNAERGRDVAIDRAKGNCLACHAVPSVDEPFQGKLGPSLAGVGRKLSAGQIRLRLIDQSRLNPKTMMPPYYRVKDLNNVAPELIGKPALEAQEIEDVVAWLMTLKG